MQSPTLEQITMRLVETRTQIEQLQAEAKQLEHELAQQIQPGTKQQVGNWQVSVTNPPRRLATLKIAKHFPATDYPDLYQPTLSTKRVREAFADDYLQANGFYTQGKPQIRIK